MKLKNFHKAKDTVSRTEWQPTDFSPTSHLTEGWFPKQIKNSRNQTSAN